MYILSEQLKAARALLGWKQEDLALKSGVSLPTIGRLEMVTGPLKAQRRTIETLILTFERAGVEFVGPSLNEVGVILRREIPRSV